MEAVDMIFKKLIDEIHGLRIEVAELRKETAEKNLARKFLTLKEACDYLRISRTTMHDRLSNGDICFAVKRGKSWLFPSDKLKEYASGF